MTDLTISCHHPGCTCRVDEAARIEVIECVNDADGHAHCAHHADEAPGHRVAAFPCQRAGESS